MNTFKKINLSVLLVMLLFSISSCDKEDDTTEADLSDDVFELAIRRVNAGQDIADFEAARDAFVAKLMEQEGTSNDREFQPFFDLRQSGLETDSVFIGMTQYQDLNTYNTLGQQLSTIPEAAPFISAFTPLVFEALQPIEGYGPVDLSEVAPLGSGQVLEIAVRDLNDYPAFDQEDYELKRDAFIDLLSQQDGFVREIQWQSVLNSNIVVGMTVYESASAVNAINTDNTFLSDPAVTEFISNYPPTVFGALNNVLK